MNDVDLQIDRAKAVIAGWVQWQKNIADMCARHISTRGKPIMLNDQYLYARDVAALCAVHLLTVHRWIRIGKLVPHLERGRIKKTDRPQRIFLRSEIMQFIEDEGLRVVGDEKTG